ncbi:MAG: HAD-IIIC family phosphatase [Chloroflexia bacterium]
MSNKLDEILALVDERSPVAAYTQAAREVRSLDGQLRPARVALLSSFTINSLVPYLQVEAARYGFGADMYVGPYNSVRQELLNPSSGCVTHHPDVVFVAQQLSEASPALVEDYLALDTAAVEQSMQGVVTDLVTALKEFRKLSDAVVVVHNFALPQYPLLGIYEPMAQGSQTETIRRLNALLVEEVKAVPGVYVLDYDRLCASVGYRDWQDDKMWYLGHAPLSALALPVLARAQAAYVQAIVGKPRKCLVLDLDNTLWGGVVGEDGVAGVKLGHTYPGSAYRRVQQALLQLYRQGVLLAINSKNNQADVDEIFRSHPDMVLKPEHFASSRINWQTKPENMLEIAAELNIGVDSLVFFDDNPVERAAMRQALPQVLTLDVPSDPMKYAQALLESRAFDKLSLTDEDRRRGQMYREQAERQRLETSAGSLEGFYRDLQMAVSIQPVDDFALPRVVDLIHKTNQFNLTTRRHPASKVSEMAADPHYGVFSLQVADRFGDNGIVGVGIVQVEGESANLDSMLLSCRVIGRTVETAFLHRMVTWAREQGATEVRGEFLPTAKNAPAQGFFAQHGFTQVSADETGSKWRLDLSNLPFEWPEYIKDEGSGVRGQGSVLASKP